MFWSSQLHACCVCDTFKLQRDASYLSQSLSVAEKLLTQWGSSYTKPIAVWLHTWYFHRNHATRHSSKDRSVGSKEHQLHQKCYKPSERDTNVTKEESFWTMLCSNCKHSLNFTCHAHKRMQLRWPKYGHAHKKNATEVTKIWLK